MMLAASESEPAEETSLATVILVPAVLSDLSAVPLELML